MNNFQVYKKTLVFSFVNFFIGFVALGLVAGSCIVGFIVMDDTTDRALIGLAVGLVIGIVLAVLINIFITNRIKAAQVGMMAKGVVDNELPDNVFSAGLADVKGRFAKITVFFMVTGAIKGIFRQLGRAINKLGTAVGGDVGGGITSAIDAAIQTLIGYLIYNNSNPNTGADEKYSTIVIDGNASIVGVRGIGKQSGATLPTGITPSMTQAQVLAYLHSIYPSMVTDAITNDVIQPDGSLKTYTYVPVGFPDGVIRNETTGRLEPVGGVGLTQLNPTIDPTTTPENTIDTFMELINTQNAYMPTETPDPPPYPETGDGITPPIVLPTGNASALWSVYNPSLAEINSFGGWLWSSNFIDQLLKLFNDPMQAIIGLHKIFATPSVSGRGNIVVGYLDSGVQTNLVSNQYTEVDCGSVSLHEYFGNALDYTDTDVYLYLPFVGIVPISTLDVTRASIHVKYKVDVFTGACLAIVEVNRDNAGGQLYTYSGSCAGQYPLSSGSYMYQLNIYQCSAWCSCCHYCCQDCTWQGL